MALAAFARCAGGLEALLAEEMRGLGAIEAKETAGGVAFLAEGASLARMLLWSRLASRILITLGELDAEDANALYESARALPWRDILPSGASFRVHGHGRSAGIRHSGFAALRIKDAICDAFRDRGLSPPHPDPGAGEFLLDLRLDGRLAVLSLDLAGSSLHKRGWRVASGGAPLKETLAAAMLLRGDWADIARAGGALIDPMCGSGTLLIEGAMIAADVAPGIARRFAAERWPGIAAELWASLRREAAERRRAGLASLRAPIIGRDRHPEAVVAARANAARAGLPVRIERGELCEWQPEPACAGGLIVCNPPTENGCSRQPVSLPSMSSSGSGLRDSEAFARSCSPTRSACSASPACARKKSGTCAMARSTARWRVSPNFPLRRQRRARRCSRIGCASAAVISKRAARRAGVEAYRIYDADLPEYAAVIDRYGEQLHIAEYRAPGEIPPPVAMRRLRELLLACREALAVPLSHMHLKERFPQSPREQYRASGADFELIVEELGLRFLVDLDRYADTGLFLDHREVRRRIRSEAEGKRVLDLFCYTGTATVAALVGGAAEVVAVDHSNTYLAWARRNLELNGVAGRRVRLVRADVREFLLRSRECFDLIHLDPPSFSNSKGAEDFDLARDWLDLLRATAARLAPGGAIFFSHHLRGFDPDLTLLRAEGLLVEDWTARVRPFDFTSGGSHRCYRIARPRPESG